MEDDINYYRAEVRAVSRVTPNMIRIIFAVTEPDTFASTGFADERLAVAFPRSERAGGPKESAQRRSYTVRAWDR